MNSFLITSSGRTGTKWLATILNKSKQWTVFHEPRGYVGDSWRIASYAFQNDYYGEVNGALCRDFEKIPFKKAIIQRPTKDLILSFANRYDEIEVFNRISQFKPINEMLYQFSLKATVFDFNLMVTDLPYLYMIFDWCNIKDYYPIETDLKPINHAIERKYQTFDDLPKSIKLLTKHLDLKEYKVNF